jgi:hypothetical protein
VNPQAKQNEVGRRLRTASCLAVLAFVIYNSNGRNLAAGDSYPARFLPFAILGYQTLYLEPIAQAVAQGNPGHYWIAYTRQGRLASTYPVVTPLIVTPLYLPAIGYFGLRGWTEPRLEHVGLLMEKLSASILTAIAVGLLYILLCRRTSNRNALLLAGATAFATNTWATSSQALWQHAAAELFFVAGLLALTSRPNARNLALAGLFFGLLVANRLPDVFLAAAAGIFVAIRFRRRAIPFALTAAFVGGLLAAYNIGMFGHLAGGYSAAGVTYSYFQGHLATGMASLLASPGKGLFIYSPFLLFLAARLRRNGKRDDFAMLDALLLISAVPLLALVARLDWRGGYCYGPRMALDIVPALVWMIAPAMPELGTRWRKVFIATVAFGMVLQAVGAFCYPKGASDVRMVNAWDPAQAQFLIEAKAGLAPVTFP